MSDETTDARVFQMTKTEAAMIAAYWPKFQEARANLLFLDNTIAEMRKEMAERLTTIAGFTVTEKMIGNMDWTKREVLVTLPKEDPPAGPVPDGRLGKIIPINRLPVETETKG